MKDILLKSQNTVDEEKCFIRGGNNMKIYINDFVENLNYRRVILQIGDVDSDKLLERLKKDRVNHLGRFDMVLGNKLMFIENCDLQDVDTENLTEYGTSILYLLEEGYGIYPLRFDEETKKYYVELEI